MQKPYKETAVANIPKEDLAFYNGDSLEYTDFLIKQLSAQLAERIMTVLSHEGEVIARLSDLRVEEYMPTNSMEYKRQIEWSPLVRCKDCVWHNKCRYEQYLGLEGFCSKGEGREDG